MLPPDPPVAAEALVLLGARAHVDGQHRHRQGRRVRERPQSGQVERRDRHHDEVVDLGRQVLALHLMLGLHPVRPSRRRPGRQQIVAGLGSQLLASLLVVAVDAQAPQDNRRNQDHDDPCTDGELRDRRR